MSHDQATTAGPLGGTIAKALQDVAEARCSRNRNAWRQRMVVELALHTGAKAAELTALTCGDVRLHPGHESLRIRSDASPRVLPLTNRLAGIFREYVGWKEEVGEDTSGQASLVCSQRGGPLTLRGWQDAWLLAQRHAGIATNGGTAVHSLESAREFAGRRIYALRNNPHDVQAWLGLSLSSNADRFRPSDLSFNPVSLRSVIEPPAIVTRRWPTSSLPELILATMYFNGTGGVMDRFEARRRLLALPEGDPLGQYWIARCLDRGRAFFPKDKELAREIALQCVSAVRDLAHGGDVMAMYLWGSEHAEVIAGGEVDPERAFHWYTKAAEQGHETSLNNIGLAYEYGRGVPRDSAMAMEYFRKGAMLHEASAMFNLAVMHAEGIGCEADLKEALRWYKKAASIGEPRSMNNLHYLYRHGLGVPKDPEAANRWYCLSGQLPQAAYSYVRPEAKYALIRAAS